MLPKTTKTKTLLIDKGTRVNTTVPLTASGATVDRQRPQGGAWLEAVFKIGVFNALQTRFRPSKYNSLRPASDRDIHSQWTKPGVRCFVRLIAEGTCHVNNQIVRPVDGFTPEPDVQCRRVL
jgi:hypothetical protein